ncbi:peptide-methionine (R)-S-oxide reductase MsrB [Paramixta manurensis]|uniref:Peptide methionine sulfoxide reductase MsrB n=2 Tax=Paramixta manurensis TaxID=2740817 RepID=A0A6M8U8S0_9GAMM|nr:peptide-methionine (R)-S-oxide reductase MsrB [Erwiniaceae bacterium PD-1]
MITRRRFILSSGAVTAAVAAGVLPGMFSARTAVAAEQFAVQYSDAQWRKKLTSAQYRILRDAGTEPPFTSPLNDEHRNGVFACAGCQLSLFDSHTKFDSHTGWPSFWQPLENAVETQRDTSFGMVRDEVHCHRCGGHLGHVFNDGPRPTGLRYCMNGLAMTFIPGSA